MWSNLTRVWKIFWISSEKKKLGRLQVCTTPRRKQLPRPLWLLLYLSPVPTFTLQTPRVVFLSLPNNTAILLAPLLPLSAHAVECERIWGFPREQELDGLDHNKPMAMNNYVIVSVHSMGAILPLAFRPIFKNSKLVRIMTPADLLLLLMVRSVVWY